MKRDIQKEELQKDLDSITDREKWDSFGIKIRINNEEVEKMSEKQEELPEESEDILTKEPKEEENKDSLDELTKGLPD